MTKPKLWKDYESISRQVIMELRSQLGIQTVEGEQTLDGASGTKWSIEGKVKAKDGILVIECRRYTTHGLSQEAVGGLAYRIRDLGAIGGILVTPLPLQAGAQIVADAEGIDHLQLTDWSTADNYLATFMGRNFHGVNISVGLTMSDSAEATVSKRPSNADHHEG